ncbi:MAG: hypothetical protein ACYTEQ_31330, partial [Planctomycetota bacterium]
MMHSGTYVRGLREPGPKHKKMLDAVRALRQAGILDSDYPRELKEFFGTKGVYEAYNGDDSAGLEVDIPEAIKETSTDDGDLVHTVVDLSEIPNDVKFIR